MNTAEDFKPALTFFGGAGTVTGSKYLLRAGKHQMLLDAGLFQGLKDLRLRNWRRPDFDPAQVEAVVLSHAHIDHSGALPLLFKIGFRGTIFCTPATADLLKVMLLDSARLQEEEAEHANRHDYSKHRPALPLYTVEDAKAALKLLEPSKYGRLFTVMKDVKVLFRRAGHILGSATVELQVGGEKPIRLVFSGDLGRWDQPILKDPEFVPNADVLLIESTYGGRLHSKDPSGDLARIVNETVQKQGVLIVPSFAVGRAQLLVWMLRRLEEEGKIPSIPVYVDSPMAINVSEIYCRHPEDHDLEMEELMDQKRCPLCCKQYHLVETAEESKGLNRLAGPAVIIAGNGMATGGRVLHHLQRRLPSSKTTVLLVGYQAAGTRGRALQEGTNFIKMYGQMVPVNAKVETIDGLSAHADQDGILRWLSGFKAPPRQTYIVHGEPDQTEALARTIREKFGWNARPAVDGETVEI